jgi:aryl-phospho-beta-D-glucosidase BglC (GH1 family)
LATRGNRLVNAATGAPVALRGLNWFGFNVGMGMVDGLWAGGHAAATDFGLIAYQIRLLGYNAVRLPFRWKDLNQRQIRQVKDCDPVSYQFLRDRLISPHVLDKYRHLELPGNAVPLRNDQPGYCNTYVPNDDGWDRLLFVVQTFVAQGMYVVLDYQPMGTENHAYDVKEFVQEWKRLWAKTACLSNFQSDLQNRVFVDVMNEPDSMQIRWEPEGGRPGARELYLETADALWEMTPNKVLFMFEGTGQNMFGLNWGNGFITDKRAIESRGLSDANPFFRALVAKPYVKASVLTPHMYPPSITRATFLGTALWEQTRTAWGYLQERGYCTGVSGSGGRCTVFPIVMGETGSAYEEAEDKQWLNDFADFINAEGGARAYNSVPINGWLWWAYNENSGDTGGIVHNGWQDLHWEKINFMISRFGLRPWYLRSDAKAVPAPTSEALPAIAAALLPGGGLDGGKAAAADEKDSLFVARLPGFSISVKLPKYGSFLPIISFPFITVGGTVSAAATTPAVAAPVTPEALKRAAYAQEITRKRAAAAARVAAPPPVASAPVAVATDPITSLINLPSQILGSFTSMLVGGSKAASVRVLADVQGKKPGSAPEGAGILTAEELYKQQQKAKWDAIMKRVQERRERLAAAEKKAAALAAAVVDANKKVAANAAAKAKAAAAVATTAAKPVVAASLVAPPAPSPSSSSSSSSAKRDAEDAKDAAAAKALEMKKEALRALLQKRELEAEAAAKRAAALAEAAANAKKVASAKLAEQAKKKQEQEKEAAEAKKLADAKAKAEDAKKKAEDAKKKVEAAKKSKAAADASAAAKKKASDADAAAKKKASSDAAAKKKASSDAAAKKKASSSSGAKKPSPAKKG